MLRHERSLPRFVRLLLFLISSLSQWGTLQVSPSLQQQQQQQPPRATRPWLYVIHGLLPSKIGALDNVHMGYILEAIFVLLGRNFKGGEKGSGCQKKLIPPVFPLIQLSSPRSPLNINNPHFFKPCDFSFLPYVTQT